MDAYSPFINPIHKNVTKGKGGKSKAKAKTNQQSLICLCPICEEDIEDTSLTTNGHDAICCEGSCKGWLHRRCAGLTKQAFLAFSSSNDSFKCPHCCLADHKRELPDLKMEIENLKKNLLSTQLDKNSHLTNPNSDSSLSSSPSNVHITATAPKSTPGSIPSYIPQQVHLDRKFNLVIKVLRRVNRAHQNTFKLLMI